LAFPRNTLTYRTGFQMPTYDYLCTQCKLQFEAHHAINAPSSDCPICGNRPTIRELIDYEAFCGVIANEEGRNRDREFEISAEELKARLDRGDDIFILDVREPHEYEICNMGGYLIPLNELPQRVNALDSSREIVVHCKLGGRSAKALEFLKLAGFRKVKNLVGGIDAWAEKVDTSMPRY